MSSFTLAVNGKTVAPGVGLVTILFGSGGSLNGASKDVVLSVVGSELCRESFGRQHLSNQLLWRRCALLGRIGDAYEELLEAGG